MKDIEIDGDMLIERLNFYRRVLKEDETMRNDYDELVDELKYKLFILYDLIYQIENVQKYDIRLREDIIEFLDGGDSKSTKISLITNFRNLHQMLDGLYVRTIEKRPHLD